MLGTQVGKVFRRIERFSEKLHPADGPLFRFPRWLRFPTLHSFNFLLLHYLYLIFMTLLGSAMLAGGGNLLYVDCVFFAAGAATQSGLNTVDFNKLATYQQIILLLIPCLCNPIVINTFVVFVRLYWFEKKFQNVVRQANEFRRHRTRSRTKSEERRDVEWAAAGRDHGVGDRRIQVLHQETGGHFRGFDKSAILLNSRQREREFMGDSTGDPAPKDGQPSSAESTEEPESSTGTSTAAFPPFHRDIRFADELSEAKDAASEKRLPEQRPPEQHIAFVENQRHPKESGALRIPDPRDWDRGDLPQRVDDSDREIERGRRGSTGEQSHDYRNSEYELNEDDHPMKPEFQTDHPRRHRLKQVAKHIPFGRKIPEDDGDAISRERPRSRTRPLSSFLSQNKEEIGPSPYLSYAPSIGRNSTFINLTEEQREELGGIEYRSLKTLAWILLVYFFGFSLLGIVIYVPWIMLTPRYKAIVQQDGQGAPWWGIFTPMSSFTDLGFTLTPDSMNSFNETVMPMLMGAILIIIGNTGFPCMLRLIIWLMSLIVPYGCGLWEELRFLLDHPRRCFTLLFPKKATWWLFIVLLVLNGIDVIFFIVLDIHDPAVTSIPAGYEFLDAVFQAASTRTAGFSCVSLADLHPAIQVSYLVMMYISVFPIAISVRQTNVYEERSFGIYGGEDALGDPDDPNAGDNAPSYLGSHLRRQLSFDLWYVFLGLFLICIIEADRLQNTNQYAFTIFTVLFEIVSAYGTVGLSLGYPGINASFSAEFRTLSKLIIVAMMLRGRHRGLPYALDRAILLPSDSLERKEKEEEERRRGRRASLMSLHNGASTTGLSNDIDRTLSGGGTFALDQPGTRESASSIANGGSPARNRKSRKKVAVGHIIRGALNAGPVHSKDHRS